MRTAAHDGRVLPVAPVLEGEALREGVAGRRVAAGDDRVRRVDGEAVVAEPVGWRHARWGGPAIRACPCYGAGDPVPASGQPTRRASRANRPQGRWARSLKKPSSAVVVPLSTIWSARTPLATSCWRLAATRSTSQWPGPSGRATAAVEGGRVDSLATAPAAPRRRPGSGRGRRPARGRRVHARVWAPEPCMARSARRPHPAAVPRHPAWTAARTPASGSTSASGTQSATRMASVTPGDVVTRMSAPGTASSSQRVPRPRSLGPDERHAGAVHLPGEDHGVEVDPEGRSPPEPGCRRRRRGRRPRAGRG